MVVTLAVLWTSVVSVLLCCATLGKHTGISERMRFIEDLEQMRAVQDPRGRSSSGRSIEHLRGRAGSRA